MAAELQLLHADADAAAATGQQSGGMIADSRSLLPLNNGLIMVIEAVTGVVLVILPEHGIKFKVFVLVEIAGFLFVYANIFHDYGSYICSLRLNLNVFLPCDSLWLCLRGVLDGRPRAASLAESAGHWLGSAGPVGPHRGAVPSIISAQSCASRQEATLTCAV